MLRDVADRLGIRRDAAIEPISGGASGRAWKVTTAEGAHVLRIAGSARLTDSRLAAMAAARDAGLPVPAVEASADTERGRAVLLSWVPGTSMLEVLLRDPASAATWGLLAGAVHRRLHAVAAPADVLDVHAAGSHPFAAVGAVPGLPARRALLHLDWHPGNLLVDETATAICGIVDWDNARAGHPLLDVARTWSMAEADPGVRALPPRDRALVAAFADSWAEGYGPEARAVPAACLAWAGRVMLADLAPRYADTPAALDAIRSWTAHHAPIGDVTGPTVE